MLKRLAKRDAAQRHSQSWQEYSEEAKQAEEHVASLKNLLGNFELHR